MRALLLALTSSACLTAANLLGLPAVPFNASTGAFDIARLSSIVVDASHANAVDPDGNTLIPPTLKQFAQTFASDLRDSAGCNLPVKTGGQPSGAAIFLTIGNESSFVDVAGRWTSEAYSLEVTPSQITVKGASPLGVWWGTRSILQQAILNDGLIPAGKGTDAPGWGMRGLMLDCGRHFYPPEFLVEMCNWMSFWKQNIFHVHLSDNLYNNPNYSYEQQLDLYARFRLWSDDPALEGLNKHRNESYTRQDFDYIQHACAARGVTVLPEIESPGHALVISQWKPELGLNGSLDLLNISYPETIPTVKTIWLKLLPWMRSKRISIGADEYSDDSLTEVQTAEEYNYFVNTMDSYINQIGDGNYRMQIWGTFPPNSSYSNQIYKTIPVQHWEFFEDFPLQDYIENGIQVLNSDDRTYIVQKWSRSYPQHLNRTVLWHGNPATGGQFAPYIFDPNNATNNPDRSNPLVLGHVAAQWNDYGANTSTFLEAYYSWRDLNAALASTQWGVLPSEAGYDSIFEKLQAGAPAQNLDRNVQSKGSTIIHYDISSNSSPGGYKLHRSGSLIQDMSGNGYNGLTTCPLAKDAALQLHKGCELTTPLGSKGRNYTLSFTVKPTSSTPGPLFTGPDSALWVGNGTSTNVTLIAAGYAHSLNYTLPVGEWTTASLIARGNRTFMAVDGGDEMEFLAVLGVNGEYRVGANLAAVAPIHMIGGGTFEGELKSVKLVDDA